MESERRSKVLENYELTVQNPPAPDRQYVRLSPEGVYALLESAGKMQWGSLSVIRGHTRAADSLRAAP